MLDAGCSVLGVFTLNLRYMKKTIYFLLLLCGIAAMTSCQRGSCDCQCTKAADHTSASYKMKHDACRDAETTTNRTMAAKYGWDTCFCALAI